MTNINHKSQNSSNRKPAPSQKHNNLKNKSGSDQKIKKPIQENPGDQNTG